MSVDDSNTKSLLHFNGNDADTTFTDESGKSWTPAGNAQIDTAQKKFGPSSGLFDGTGDYISTPDHSDFNPGAGEFTIEMWVKAAGGSDPALCSKGGAAADWAFEWEFDISSLDNGLSFSYSGNGATTHDVYTYGSGISHANLMDGNFHHVAVARSGFHIYLFIDGVMCRDNADIGGMAIYHSTEPLYIATTKYAAGLQLLNGWSDEFRYSRVARWTSSFTPPVYPYGWNFIPRISIIYHD